MTVKSLTGRSSFGRTRFIGVLGAMLLAVTGIGTSPAAAATSGEIGVPSADIVDLARSAPLVRYHRDLPGGAYTNQGNQGGGSVIMAYAALAGDSSVHERLLQQIRYTLTGGNDIAANGGYPAQHELQVTSMFAIVKNVPAVWGQLTEDERARADAMMRASLVAGAFTTSDNNPYVVSGEPERTLDADTNVGRGWNPNYREGMAGSVLVATAFLGVEEAANFLENYDHAEFAASLCTLGLDNSCEIFNWKRDNPDSTAPSGPQIESAVHSWSLWGVPLPDVMGLAADLAFNTYGRTVECGVNGGEGIPAPDAPGGVAGIIDSGCEDLPNVGQPGMLLEFDAVDGGGPRSATYYAFGGLKPSLFVQGALIVNGLWERGPVADEIASLIDVGATDLWYKLEHGYRNYSIGAYRGIQTIDSAGYGFGYIRSLWEDVLAPYYGIVPAPSHVRAMLDRFVAAGSVVGSGPAASAPERLRAFRTMVDNATALVEAEQYDDARDLLRSAQLRIHTNGPVRAAHLVTGVDTPVVYGLLDRLHGEIGPVEARLTRAN